jgi:hypothetical protein
MRHGQRTLARPRLVGDPNLEVSWEHGLAAMCSRCWKILMDAGGVGKKRKGSNERWWLGHDVGKNRTPE